MGTCDRTSIVLLVFEPSRPRLQQCTLVPEKIAGKNSPVLDWVSLNK